MDPLCICDQFLRIPENCLAGNVHHNRTRHQIVDLGIVSGNDQQDQLDQGKNWLEAVRYCQEYACHERIDTTIRYLADDQPTDNPAMMERIFNISPAQNGQSVKP